MAEAQTHDVVVHKANIALADGESIGQYTNKLRDAGRKWVNQKLNLVKDSSVYPVEIFSKSIVFDVYQYGPNVAADKRARFYAAAYTRKESGDFEFSTLTEVERVTTYQAKQTAATVAKAKTDKAEWTTAFINDLPDAAFAVILPGGKKDAAGKTTPRSLRVLPHHNANVKSPTEDASVDLPHLRNALARISQANIPAAAKSRALAHLQAHAKKLLKTTPAKKDLHMKDAPGWAVTEKTLWAGVV